MKEAIADFHRLERRLRLSGVLVTRTALRIGSGGGGTLDAADLPVLRDADGFPFIPGGSLKGVIRSTVEALVRGADAPQGSGLWACDPLAEGKGADKAKACGFDAAKEREKGDIGEHCALCCLFGSRMVASHARFSDAMAIVSDEDRTRRRIPIEVRDGVAIDRDLRVVHGAQKYDFEVVSPGTHFDLEIFVENPKPWLMGLLVIGFDQLSQGFSALGGFTSRGLGRVEMEWTGMSEVTARDLLEGKEARSVDKEGLGAEFKSWREALAKRARGEA